MNGPYEHCQKVWNDIFAQEEARAISSGDAGNSQLNESLDWLCEKSRTILDFGCGNGMMLFLCARRGTVKHTGIDLAENGIRLARNLAALMGGDFDFQSGSLEKLKEVGTASQDAVLLSNILDNLYPQDGRLLMQETSRILKNGGKCLIKLNPYITQEQICEWKLRVIQEDVLDDGLILWNQTSPQWQSFLGGYLQIVEQKEIYYSQYDQYNRIFHLFKKSL